MPGRTSGEVMLARGSDARKGIRGSDAGAYVPGGKNQTKEQVN